MGRIVIVVYRPLPRKDKELESLVKRHVEILRAQELVTDREPVFMRAEDGCIVEVFEWRSAAAINQAHTNPEVAQLWNRFNEVCTYERPVSLKEFNNLFSEFESID